LPVSNKSLGASGPPIIAFGDTFGAQLAGSTRPLIFYPVGIKPHPFLAPVTRAHHMAGNIQGWAGAIISEKTTGPKAKRRV